MVCLKGNIYVAHSVGSAVAQDGSAAAARTRKPQMPSFGKKYHQPISFSFADIMEKVTDFNNIFCPAD